MQPFFPIGRRNTRRVLPFFVFICGMALGVIPPVKTACVLGAENHPHYSRLPIVGNDWTAVQSLPDGQQRMEREQLRQGEYFRRWQAIHRLMGPQHVSRKGQQILAKRGLGPARLQDLGASGKSFSGVDTLRVLVIRIGFEANRDSQLTTIDPSGDFVLTPPADPGQLIVDPPPHNKAFYEAHLQGLSEYYDYQSGGRLQIQGRVLPEGQNDSYKLSDVADYGPGTDGFWSVESLERLVRDMIVKADQETAADGSANLSLYDDDSPFTYIIFVHAGSDWQSDINGDSPNDIPTFFVTLGEPQDLTASGGALSECSIIPETTTQDDYPGSIAAAFYHEFGHALGLVDIYNTTSGLPQVGIWDLMDSGTNLPVVLGQEEPDGSVSFITAVGVLPPSLGVWNKWFLGWVDLDEVDSRAGDFKLPAVQVPRDQYPLWDSGSGDFDLSYPQALKAGASPREYFLLENRYVPFPDSTSTFTPYSGFSFERDEQTGVVLYLAGLRGNTWSNTGMYDYFLPAGGLLVWHVNNDRIAANLETNTVNAWGDGIRLLEADGIQDIGVLDSYVLGWYGSWRDPFGEDNGFQNIYLEDFPSSRLYDRSWSGLTVSDIRANGSRSSSVMRFQAAISPLAAGFPWEVAEVDSAAAAQAGGLAGPRALEASSGTPVTVGNQEILIIGDAQPADWSGGVFPAALYAISESGEPIWPAPSGLPEGAIVSLGAPLAGPPVAVTSFSGAEAAVAWATSAGLMGLTSLDSGTNPGGWQVNLGSSIYGGALSFQQDGQGRLLACVGSDSLFVLDHSGNLVGQGRSLADESGFSGTEFAAPARLVPGATPARAVVFMDQGFMVADLNSSAPELNTSAVYPRALSGSLQTALISDQGSAKLHIFDDDGHLGCWELSAGGGLSPADPLAIAETLVTEPAVADVDGDGRDDLILLTATHIRGYQYSGIALRGFPVRFYDLFPLDPDTRLAGPTAVVDATGDGVNEVFVQTDGGHLVGLGPTGRLLDRTPFLWGDTAGAGMAVGQASPVSGKRHLYLISQGGYTGAPLDRQFTNGRVAAYQLDSTSDQGQATSGWFGAAGGALRAGSQGSAQAIAGMTPAAQDRAEAYLYPNPVRENRVTLRFYAGQAGEARFELYNLEGEEVARESFVVSGDVVHEQSIDCSAAGSGIYLARLVYPGAAGPQIKTMTLAVER